MNDFSNALHRTITDEAKAAAREEIRINQELLNGLLIRTEELERKLTRIADRDINILEVERVLSESDPGGLFAGATNAYVGRMGVGQDLSGNYVEFRADSCTASSQPLKNKPIAKGDYTVLVLLFRTDK